MRERISTGGGPIPVAALAALIERNQPKVEAAEAELQARPSHFEVLTALALTYFAEQRADAMVVEVRVTWLALYGIPRGSAERVLYYDGLYRNMLLG